MWATKSSLFCWDGVSWTFCPVWPQTVILPISVSQRSMIIGMRYRHLAALAIFQIRFHFFLFSFFARDSFGPPSSYLWLLCSWDYRYLPLHLALLLRWGVANFLSRLVSNCNLPNIHLPCSCDYRCVAPHLAPNLYTILNWGPDSGKVKGFTT
jgi:hypothetical protein